jgi:3D-(3,5/4)-trihydroxycyclohexane-1,2-dione acylhydrolase (decyclizing)
MDRTVVIHVEADREARVGSYEAWWDVPVAEVSDDQAVRAARGEYEQGRAAERWHL